jgi:hypothetical protein
MRRSEIRDRPDTADGLGVEAEPGAVCILRNPNRGHRSRLADPRQLVRTTNHLNRQQAGGTSQDIDRFELAIGHLPAKPNVCQYALRANRSTVFGDGPRDSALFSQGPRDDMLW